MTEIPDELLEDIVDFARKVGDRAMESLEGRELYDQSQRILDAVIELHKPKPDGYPFLRRFGSYCNWSLPYRKAQLHKARADNAPADALCYSRQLSRWLCYSELAAEPDVVKLAVQILVSAKRIDRPKTRDLIQLNACMMAAMEERTE